MVGTSVRLRFTETSSVVAAARERWGHPQSEVAGGSMKICITRTNTNLF